VTLYLGIDPGLAHLGLGVVDAMPGRVELVHADSVDTAPADGAIELRLRILIKQTVQLALHYRPLAVGIEEQAGVGYAKEVEGKGRNFAAGYARDAALALFGALEALGFPCWYVRPQSWHVVFLGKGSAGAQPVQIKARVQRMTRAPGCQIVRMNEHSCDAVGIAVGGATVHLQRRVRG
jgi:Holliday junction resolvasome RuvABC endonuclease subunit